MGALARYCAAAVSFVLCSPLMGGEELWTARSGQTTIAWDRARLDAIGLTVFEQDGKATRPVEGRTWWAVGDDSTLTVAAERGVLQRFNGGAMTHAGGVILGSQSGKSLAMRLALAPVIGDDEFALALVDAESGMPVFGLRDSKVGFDRLSAALFIEAGELTVSASAAAALGDPGLSGAVVGSMLVAVDLELMVPADDVEMDDGGVAGGNSGTTCPQPGGPDVIVGVLYNIANYAKVGSIDAFTVGTISCNIGDTNLSWVSSTNQHPVIGQNLFRLKGGQFEHIGQSWLKHGFTALTNDDCGCGCNGVGGSQLGVGCSDPYSAGLNGQQSGLGPKFEVNAFTGFFAYPYTGQGTSGNSIFKRIQVAVADIDPAQSGGGDYFIEGHYVTPDDAAAANQHNNASYRSVTFSDGNSDGDWDIALGGSTVREQPGIRAWKTTDPTVTETDVTVPSDGLVIVSSKATDLGGGLYHYEYAVQNLNSERSIGSFTVPIPNGTSVSNVAFHDVDYHSGEPFDGTNWTPTVGSASVSWATTPYGTNPNANAIRWGTLYNFRFDANVMPISSTVTLGLFKPGSPTSVNAAAVVPFGTPPVCGDSQIGPGEDCDPPDGVHCSAQCQWICGDGVTQSGEECDDGNAVNNDGCTNNCTLPTCGDGVVQGSEECDDGNTINNDGCSNACTLPECGDGIVQAGETCDDGNTISNDGCSSTCQAENNDACASATPVGNGAFAFDTTAAATDGPTPSCENAAEVAHDVWYDYTAACTGTATFSTCGTASFDTAIAVYGGCACPASSGSQLGCDDDASGCAGNTSLLTLAVTQGECYKVRVGGWRTGNQGTGTLNISCAGVSCGNGTLEAGEECDPPNGTTCDSSCQRIPVCGDGFIDVPEACDDGNTTPGDGCSAACQIESGPPNDACANRIAIGDGTSNFDNTGATTDGPDETGGNCGKFGYTQVDSDIWYCYTATCNGTATASLCGSGFDTKLAVYDGCTCPTSASAMACNDDSCTLQSQADFSVAAGSSYLIRVGGYQGATGAGTLAVSCAPVGCQSATDCNDSNPCTDDSCNAGTCVNANNSLSCDDGNACTTTDVCSGGACVGGPPPTCSPGAGNCTDCNNNMVRDDCEGLADCDGNGYPDVCEYADCNNNGQADVCDIFNGVEVDCDGGPIGSKAAGQTRFNSLCVFCHGAGGVGGVGPNIQNHTRVDIWDMLLPPTDHPGGAHPEYSQQDFADLEAYLAQAGSRGRPDRVPDSCQTLADCDDNSASDGCELEAGSQVDADYNGIPDGCTCQGDGDCDDGVYCNGLETCVAGACQPGTDACPTTLCDEALDQCVECLTSADCDDGVFCNGAEGCSAGACVGGADPCPGSTCVEAAGRCVPNSCDPPTAIGAGPRYLDVVPAPAKGPVALIVTGDSLDGDVSCVSLYAQADGSLGATPVYRTAAEWGTLHVHGSEIMPSHTYEVSTDCGAEGFAVLSSATSATTWPWGDATNNGLVNLDDILGVIRGFAGEFNVPPSFCTPQGVDLLGCTPDGVVNLDDILGVLAAFQGSAMNCSMPCP